MVDIMTFPDTVEEFMEQYKITDTAQIYTNGAELVSIFRMKQWFDHKPERKTGKWVKKVDDGVYWYECSECGDYPLKSAFGHDYFSEWCPHCGAKLEGVEECQR